jgi:predicted small lipoprotein YifL
MQRHLVRLLAVLAASLLLLAACGDDDSTATPPADTADQDGTDAGDTDATDTTDAADDDAPPATAGGTDRGDLPNLAAIGDFCDLFRAFDDIDDEVFFGDDPDMSPEESAEAMAIGFQYMEALFARAVQLAPGEIRDEMATIAAGMAAYNSLLAEYDYDFMAMAVASMEDPELEERFAAIESDEFEDASDRIEAYVLAECGVDLS